MRYAAHSAELRRDMGKTESNGRAENSRRARLLYEVVANVLRLSGYGVSLHFAI